MKNFRFKIYVADDNPQYLALMAGRLQSSKTEVKSFLDGKALLTALQQRPDIVVLDHRFGEHDVGIELLRSIKAYDPSVHVILVSGQKQVEVAIEALKGGASDYLEKNGNEFQALEGAIARIMHIERERRRKRSGITGFFSKLIKRSKAAVALTLLLATIVGCTPQKLPLSFTKARTAKNLNKLMKSFPHIISSDDKISLSVWNNDDISVGSVFGIYNSNEVYGKWVLVDEAGDVTLPMLGKVHLAGKTTRDAEAWLKAEFGKEIREPVVVLRVLNREVTITGEVKEPGNFILDKEKNTLAEVLGKAEGFTDYAKLKDVTLTRDAVVYELNLHKMSGTNFSRIYIQPGDVIDIPERAGKRLERKMPLLIPLASLATSIGVLISVTRKSE